MSAPLRLLLLGGGHAHVQVLDAWARSPLPGVQLTLVTPFSRQMYSGMVPGMLAGHYSDGQCVIPLEPLAAAAGARLWLDRVVALDAAAGRVTLADGQSIEADWLSIDTGPEMDREAIPGAAEHGLFVRPIELFVQQAEMALARAAQRPLHAVMIGGGAAGFELALALAFRLRQAGDGRSRVTLLSGGPLLPGSPAAVVQRARRVLDLHGVGWREPACVAMAADHVQLADGSRIDCDLRVLCIGAAAPRWLTGSGLALDGRGFVSTGPTLQSVSHAKVFAAGDVATRVDAPRPKSGVHAVRAGPPLANNLRHALLGQPLQPYQPQQRTLYLLSCGERSAIASWGGWSTQGRWVWWWKDRIDRAFVARYTRDARDTLRETV